MTDRKQLLLGIVVGLAILIAGYAAASPQNLQIVVLFLGAILLVATNFVPRIVVYAWILSSGILMPIWQEQVSARLTIHATTAIILFALLLLRWTFRQSWPKIRWWELAWPVFTIACTLSAARESTFIPMNPIFIFRNLFMPFAFYLFAQEFFRDRTNMRWMALAIMVVAIAMAFVGYYEYTTNYHIWYRNKEVVVNSAYGPYFSPGRYGLMQVIGFFMALYFFWDLRQSKKLPMFFKALFGVILVLLAYSAILCSERGVIVAFGVALLYNIYRMRNRMIGLLVAVVLVAGVTYNVEKLVSEAFIEQKMNLTDVSVKRRVAQWISAARIFVDKPIFGVGYHYFTNPNRVDKYVTYFEGTSSRGKLIHNSPLDILATSGLVALIPFMTFLTGLFITLVKSVRRNRGDPYGYFALMALSIFITQQLQNQTAIEVYSEVLNTMTFLIYGAVVGYQRYVIEPLEERERQQKDAETPSQGNDYSDPAGDPTCACEK